MQNDIDWNPLVNQCNTLEDYVKILIAFSSDNIFNIGRNHTIIEYTKLVGLKNPIISNDIHFVLDLFLFKSNSIILHHDRNICSIF